MSERLCKKCKHAAFVNEYYGSGYWLCRLAGTDPVTGGYNEYCYAARKEGGVCGPEGKLWEEMPPPPPRVKRKGWFSCWID